LASATIYLPFAQMVDLEAERARLKRDLDEIEEQIARSQGLLVGQFGSRAPAAVVQKERDKLAALKDRQVKLTEQIDALS
jgi:valyl-tRNA synthetase